MIITILSLLLTIAFTLFFIFRKSVAVVNSFDFASIEFSENEILGQLFKNYSFDFQEYPIEKEFSIS